MITAQPAEAEPPDLEAVSDYRVGDYMTADPITVTEDARAARVLELMEQYNIKHVPVVRDGVLVALVSERHLRDAMPSILTLKNRVARRKTLELTPVLEIAIDDPETVEPDTSLLEAIRRLRRLRAGSLPVVANGKLVGILTGGDLISLLETLLRRL